jgi:rhamnogalacturonyl hydrolase YesR
MQIHFAIPPNSAFLGLLEEFFFSISNIRKFHHIINQFVKKFSTFPDSPYPMPETSGTGLYTYALLYGINSGLLDEATYLPVVKKGWEAMVKAVDTEGKLCWTQTVAAKPDKVEKKNNRPYSSGALLMIASEIMQYIHKN